MKIKPKVSIALIFIVSLVGFMLAVQYNSLNHQPAERDTRDIWAIRNEIAEQKQAQSELLKEIRDMDHTLYTYERAKSEDPEMALIETVEDLKKRAGFTSLTGPGVEIEIQPSPESIALGLPIETIQADLLTRFINDVNRMSGLIIEIDSKRYTILSAIRDINGVTTVNGLNVKNPPFTIKIVTETFEDSEKVYNYLLASPLHDDFYIDNLIIDIHEPSEQIELNGWTEQVELMYLQQLPKEDD